MRNERDRDRFCPLPRRPTALCHSGTLLPLFFICASFLRHLCCRWWLYQRQCDRKKITIRSSSHFSNNKSVYCLITQMTIRLFCLQPFKPIYILRLFNTNHLNCPAALWIYIINILVLYLLLLFGIWRNSIKKCSKKVNNMVKKSFLCQYNKHHNRYLLRSTNKNNTFKFQTITQRRRNKKTWIGTMWYFIYQFPLPVTIPTVISHYLTLNYSG